MLDACRRCARPARDRSSRGRARAPATPGIGADRLAASAIGSVDLRVFAVGDEVAVVGDERMAVGAGPKRELHRRSGSASARSVRALPNGITSTGICDRTEPGMYLLSSTITTNRAADAATIFSRNIAPPRPLIRRSAGIDAVGAVHGDVETVGPKLLHENALLDRKRGARHRGRDRADRQAVAHPLGEAEDEPACRRPGTEADAHTVLDQWHRGFPGRAAGDVDVHPCSVAVRTPGVCSVRRPLSSPARDAGRQADA